MVSEEEIDRRVRFMLGVDWVAWEEGIPRPYCAENPAPVVNHFFISM